jgi:hypothetical protein
VGIAHRHPSAEERPADGAVVIPELITDPGQRLALRIEVPGGGKLIG